MGRILEFPPKGRSVWLLMSLGMPEKEVATTMGVSTSAVRNWLVWGYTQLDIGIRDLRRLLCEVAVNQLDAWNKATRDGGIKP